MADGLSQLDWGAAWLAPWQLPGQALAQLVLAGLPVFEALNAAGPAPVRFAFQLKGGGAAAYELGIHDSGCVPTRNNLHDFFNGLCWLQFPRTKHRLNQLQAQALLSSGGQTEPGRRGALRDALTLFDENAALLQCPDALWDALCARQWTHLFGPLRPLWQQASLVVFGHALLTQLAHPYKGITAHVWRVTAPCNDLASLDAWLSSDLSPQKLAAKPFSPLPVLGVPGWWPANEQPVFYEDSAVFRPAPLRSPTQQRSA